MTGLQNLFARPLCKQHVRDMNSDPHAKRKSRAQDISAQGLSATIAPQTDQCQKEMSRNRAVSMSAGRKMNVLLDNHAIFLKCVGK